jgi:hypothetical protein
MERVQQHGATPQRKPLADRPLKSRDRRAAHGNGTAFSAVAPSSGPHWPPVDPITREWYCPQARIAGDPTFHRLVRFPRMLLAHWHCQVVWPACYIPSGKSLGCFYDLRMHSSARAAVALQPLAAAPVRQREAQYSDVERSRSCEFTSPSLLPPASAGFSYCFTGGRPNVDLYLEAISPTPHPPTPTSRRRPRAVAWHAPYPRCGACSDKQHAMRWP